MHAQHANQERIFTCPFLSSPLEHTRQNSNSDIHRGFKTITYTKTITRKSQNIMMYLPRRCYDTSCRLKLSGRSASRESAKCVRRKCLRLLCFLLIKFKGGGGRCIENAKSEDIFRVQTRSENKAEGLNAKLSEKHETSA